MNAQIAANQETGSVNIDRLPYDDYITRATENSSTRRRYLLSVYATVSITIMRCERITATERQVCSSAMGDTAAIVLIFDFVGRLSYAPVNTGNIVDSISIQIPLPGLSHGILIQLSARNC